MRRCPFVVEGQGRTCRLNNSLYTKYAGIIKIYHTLVKPKFPSDTSPATMTRDEYEPDYSANGQFYDRERSRNQGYGNKSGYGHRDGYSSGRDANYSRSSYGGSQQNEGGFGRGLAAALEPVEFSKLEPIVKNVYKEHEEVSKLTHEEISKFRREAEMVIQGQDVPK